MLYTANLVHLVFDADDVSAHVTEVIVTPSCTVVEVTAGATTTHTELAAGLRDFQLQVKLVYDLSHIAMLISLLRPSRLLAVTFGPQGNTLGSPHHVQTCLVERTTFRLSHRKHEVLFDVTLRGAAAPTADMFMGAVY